MIIRLGAALLLAIGTLTAGLAPANAETITFNIRSNHPNTVGIEFYSQNRRVSWPGNGKYWVINDYDVHNYRLTCQYGERICYGAWVVNSEQTYWGVGLNNSYRCSNCCWTCDGTRTNVQNLNP